MGVSVRTAEIRYTEWRDWHSGRVVARELYDHSQQPEERVNSVDDAQWARALAQAEMLLEAQFPRLSPGAKR